MSQTQRMTTGVVSEAEYLADLLERAGLDGHYCPHTEVPAILTQARVVTLIASVSDLNAKYTVAQLRNGLDAQQTIRSERELRQEMDRLNSIQRPICFDTYKKSRSEGNPNGAV